MHKKEQTNLLEAPYMQNFETDRTILTVTPRNKKRRSHNKKKNQMILFRVYKQKKDAPKKSVGANLALWS